MDPGDYDHQTLYAYREVAMDEVRVSLRQHIGAPSQATVSVGDRVVKGQLIGTIPDGQLGSMIHARIAGQVISVDERQVVIAADAAAKAVDVKMIEVRLAMAIGGKSFIVMTGELSAVNADVDAGIPASKDAGTLIAKTVIPSPTKEFFQKLL